MYGLLISVFSASAGFWLKVKGFWEIEINNTGRMMGQHHSGQHHDLPLLWKYVKARLLVSLTTEICITQKVASNAPVKVVMGNFINIGKWVMTRSHYIKHTILMS